MTDQTNTAKTSPRPVEFKGSLVRTVVIGLIIISVLPALIIGLFTYFRTQDVLREQTSDQLSSISDTFIKQLNEASNTNLVTMYELQDYPNLSNFLSLLVEGKKTNAYLKEQLDLKIYLQQFLHTPSGSRFALVSIFDRSGSLVVSSNLALTQDFVKNEDLYLNLIGARQRTIMTVNPGGLFPDQLVLVTSIPLTKDGEILATAIGFSVSKIPATILQSSRTMLANSRAYLVSADNAFVTNYPGSSTLLINNLSEEQRKMISGYIEQSGSGAGFEYKNIAGQQVFSYITKINMLDSAFVLEIPADSVFSKVRSILPSLLLIILAVLLVSSSIVSIAARRMVIPLVDLSKRAQDFASGDWTFRARIDRNDEIGMLAYSFNKMVDELTNIYHSLETRVEEKTRQFRTTTEIGQSALTYTNRTEILESIPGQLVEKLGIPYAAVYLFDPLQNKAVLVANACNFESTVLPEKGIQITSGSNSLVGWTCSNRQTRFSDDLSIEKTFTDKKPVVSFGLSQVTIPIVNANSLYGILDLQSDKSGEFDQETISIYTSFADQISSGIQNIQSLENAQINLRETTTLYQISRELSHVQTSNEVEASITKYFGQTELVSIFFKCFEDQVQFLAFSDPKGTSIDQTLIGFNIPLSKGLVKIREGNIILLDDLKSASDLSNLTIYFDKRSCRSLVLFPIIESGKLAHLLAIGTRSPEPLSNLQIQTYHNFCEVIGSTLERIGLLEQLNLRVQELSTITTVGEAATTAIDRKELFSNLFDKLKAVLGEDIGFVVALNDQVNGKILIPFYFDEEEQNIAAYTYSNDLISQTILSKDAILHRDANSIGQYCVDSPDIRIFTRSFLGIPLIVSGETVGAIALLHRSEANRFSESELSLLNTLAPQIGTSIRNVELLDSQRSAIQAYDKERFLLNSLLQNTPDRIVIKDHEGKFVRVSDSFASSIGVADPTSLIGQIENTRIKLGDQLIDPDTQILESGTTSLGEIEEIPTAEGKSQWFLTSRIPLIGQDQLSNALLRISREITDLISTQRLSEYRSNQLIIASEVARETSMGSLQMDEMLTKMVNLVKSRFAFYHSSVFLIDPIGQYAVLKESTGEAGAQLKAAGHKLAVGSTSIVGQATSLAEPVVVNDVSKEANYYPNPLLPETKSELAIPLKVGQKLIGALDVQSQNVDAFTQEDVNILQIMADQLSIAIENANLFSKTQKTLQRHRLLHQVSATTGQSVTIEDAIRNAVQTIHLALPNEQIAFLTADEIGTYFLLTHIGYSQSEIADLRIQASNTVFSIVAKSNKPILVNDTNTSREGKSLSPSARSILSVPVSFANKSFGVLNVESNTPGAFDDSDQEIIITLADNLASIIANIELVNQVSLQVERQRQLYDITNKIRRSVDIETIMQTSLSEVCNALNIRRASVQLYSQSSSGSQASGALPDNQGTGPLNRKEFGK